MVTVKEVQTYREKRKFAKFNADMYKHVEQAVPDLISDEMANFNPKKNPAYSYCRAKQFLAYKDGKVVGRIAGIISGKSNVKWNAKQIRFSRVDFIDDYEVSKALFEAVENWGRKEGLEEIHGPIGFCDLDQEGMLIDGFDETGMFITINNAPYYKKHLEQLGYKKDIDWVEYRIKMPEQIPERLERLSSAVVKRYKLNILEFKTMRQIDPYIRKIFDVINDTYKDLYGEVSLTEEQKYKYYNQFKLMINPQYVKLIESKEGELISFGLAVPSMNDAVRKSRGRLFPFGWYRILRAPRKKAEVLDLYLVGVLPKYQKCGVPAVLITEMCKTGIKNGIKYAETGPELETNTNVQALWKAFETRQHRRRRCFIKQL